MEKQIITFKSEAQNDYNYDEAIKTLRTNLQFCGNNIRTVMFTSAMPDEGKSDISFAISRSLAQIGRKTLMIDCDIRKSILVTRYHVQKEVNGLTHYLTGQKMLDEIIYGTNAENMDVIFAGPYSPKPTELLEENLFPELLIYAKQNYDYVIIDTPPMANLIDGAIVARQCDGAVLVIESGAVSRRLEQRVKEQLVRSGCQILGVVLNKIDIYHDSYYDRYGKYSKYGKYGKYDRYGREDKTQP
ncbi:MAG: CpsD/CapB family tyrosine-protein kinase [Clostridiales bacterium]|nr:CpsD/CapB family tyrosine-protein kinase [Clostridiales bacterium]